MTDIWIWIWQIFFIAVLLGFGVMALWVTVAGFRDIKKLFARLKDSDGDS